MMRVLVACEESQEVCNAFRDKGHEAYSCDIKEPSGGHPEWHIQGDVLKILEGGWVVTMDMVGHNIPKWDLIIAHPPCTYLSNVATRAHSLRMTPLDKITERTLKRIDAMRFFMVFATCSCERVAIENQIGVMSSVWRKPDQTIHPYQFAEDMDDDKNYVTKATCLWLKGLLPLLPTWEIPRPDNEKLYGRSPKGKVYDWESRLDRKGGASKARSKTFPGIARAMAEQWGDRDE